MAEPQTLVVPGEGGSVLAYPLPAGVLQYVESVVAVIDNAGGGDTIPVLSIATGGGTPIADKEQGRSIPAGDSGRATWAHRLTDEGGGGGGTADKIEYVNQGFGTAVSVGGGNTTHLKWERLGGDVLLDYTNPLLPVVIADGFYSATTIIVPDDQFAGFINGRHIGGVFGAAPGAQGVITWSNVGPAVNALTLTTVEQWGAGQTLQYFLANSQPTAALVPFVATIVKLQ